MAKNNGQEKAQAAEMETAQQADAKETTQQADAKETTQQASETENAQQEKVLVTLFKDGDRYKDPLYVSVNGRSYLIQRGVPVEVPRYVAEVIQNSLQQDNAAQLLISRLVEGYEASTRAQG